MTRGRAVQVGSASELFERPAHTFVGNFIGSPGMNFLPASALPSSLASMLPAGATTLGVRPEYVSLAEPDAAGALTAVVTRAQDIGTYWLLTATAADGAVIRARLGAGQAIPAVGAHVWLSIVGSHTCFYKDEELVA